MLNETQNANAPLHLAPRSLSPAPPTILVVEDEAFVREVACDILEGEGYQVLRARDATEARAAFHIQQGNVQLLLSDVILPGQNGPTLAKDLSTACPALRVMFISGYVLNPDAESSLAAGGRSYLRKPFSAESLVGKVKKVLE